MRQGLLQLSRATPAAQCGRMQRTASPARCRPRAASVALLLAATWASARCPPPDLDAALVAASSLRAAGALCGSRGAFAPAPALRPHAALQRMAERHAHWLAARAELAHEGEGGAPLARRAQDAGYAYARMSENLGLGQADAASALQAWLASGGHCANLLDPHVSEAGLACATTAAGRPLWVMVFARPLAAVPLPPAARPATSSAPAPRPDR